MEYLILDGYNIINSWGDFFNLKEDSLEECRNKLLNTLSNYQGYKKANIIVVFDAHMVKDSQEKVEYFDNIKVVFTKENETADNYIERFVYKYGSTHIIRVVTSDYLEQTLVMSKGGIRITPRELKLEIENVCREERKVLKNKPVNTNSLMNHLKPELLKELEKIRRSKF
ncbi:MAG: NYN domain-containing protein [Acetivibrionales bacterium]|jgi:predicted RNA-binding protein with PIN domain